MNELGNKREPAHRYPTEVQLISTEWLMVKRALIYASKLVKDRDLRSPVEHRKLVLEGWPGQIRPRSQNTAPVLNDCPFPNHSERCHNFASESSSGLAHLLTLGQSRGFWKELGLEVRQTWVWIWSLMLPSCMTLGQSLTVSVLRDAKWGQQIQLFSPEARFSLGTVCPVRSYFCGSVLQIQYYTSVIQRF